MELPPKLVPGKGRRRVGRRRQFDTFIGVIVGEKSDPRLVGALAQHRSTHRPARRDGGQHHSVGLSDSSAFRIVNPLAEQRKPTVLQPVHVQIGTAILFDRSVFHSHPRQVLVDCSCHRANATGGATGR